MHESATALSVWESFYVIVGSSGGALIGLQFVVITLIADNRLMSSQGAALSAFGTPTVVHFTWALAVSAMMSAPWPSLGLLAITLGSCGVAGLVYCAIVIRRARRQTEYRPVFEDWVFYGALPCCTYGALIIGALHSARTRGRRCSRLRRLRSHSCSSASTTPGTPSRTSSSRRNATGRHRIRSVRLQPDD